MLSFVRFTLRDLTWFLVVMALALGWSVDRQRLVRRHALEKEAILQQAADMVHEATNDFGDD